MFLLLTLQTVLVAAPVPKDKPKTESGPGYLGVQIQSDGSKNGFEIAEVFDNSPAKKAGLEKNDVLLKFGGEEVGSDVDKMVRKIVKTKPGTSVEVEVRREGKELKLKVTIGTRPEDFSYPIPELNESKDEAKKDETKKEEVEKKKKDD